MDFHARMRAYFSNVAQNLEAEGKNAAVFPNPVDNGQTREASYANFLRGHLPARCSVFLGGYLFHVNGTESSQLDILITTDTTPRYDLPPDAGLSKSFAPVEGTVGAVSVKATLDKTNLEDSLAGFASIPPTESLTGRIGPFHNVPDYGDWPYKIIYASKGLSPETLIEHINSFYLEHPEIPLDRRPNLIHVNGKLLITKTTPGMTVTYPGNETLPLTPGTFVYHPDEPDLKAFCICLHFLQRRVSICAHIEFGYSELYKSISKLSRSVRWPFSIWALAGLGDNYPTRAHRRERIFGSNCAGFGICKGASETWDFR